MAMHMEMIRREAETLTQGGIQAHLGCGGGTRNKFWLQTKAHVFGFPLTVLTVSEAALQARLYFPGWAVGSWPWLS